MCPSDLPGLGACAGEGEKGGHPGVGNFIYPVTKYGRGFVAGKDRREGILFTAGVGENGPDTRKGVCSYLGYLGVELDDEANQVRGEEKVISTPNSKVTVLCLPTNEELAIARETVALAGK